MLRQEIHFCRAPDGVRIAYAAVGNGPPLVKAANWLNHLEYDWQGPIWSHLLHALAARHRLVRYDERGNGLSDRDVDDISLDAFVHDLESVVAATGLERFALLGISQGCAVSIAYAVRHPERVSRLILYGGYARGRRKRGRPSDIEQADAILTLIRQGWAQENPAFRQFFTSQFMPDATAEQAHWFNELQRLTTSAENAARIRQALDEMDVSGLLSSVRAPTLVLHCRDDAIQPFEEGRLMAAGIAGSRFVALEGRNHILLEHEPAWTRFIEEVTPFLDGGDEPDPPVRAAVPERVAAPEHERPHGPDRRPHVVIVEDEATQRQLLLDYLGRNDFRVSGVAGGAALRSLVERELPQLVLLDIGLAGEDGIALARWLRERSGRIGIIMVTAATDTVDRVAGLESGADDYIPKPFEPRELIARVKSVLRRVTGAAGTPGPRVRMGRVVLDLERHVLCSPDGDAEESLTASEFDLLRAFADHPNRPLNRDWLLEVTSHREMEAFDRSIDLRVARLRRKIEPDPAHPTAIRTVRGAGYMFVPPTD